MELIVLINTFVVVVILAIFTHSQYVTQSSEGQFHIVCWALCAWIPHHISYECPVWCEHHLLHLLRPVAVYKCLVRQSAQDKNSQTTQHKPADTAARLELKAPVKLDTKAQPFCFFLVWFGVHVTFVREGGGSVDKLYGVQLQTPNMKQNTTAAQDWWPGQYKQIQTWCWWANGQLKS